MPRAIWTGAISFGMVTVPVKLYSAVNRKTVRFHQLSGKSGVRVSQKRIDPQSGEEVPYESLVKGYEIAPERYVVIEPGELETLQPKNTKTIEIEDFVELSQIDPVYYDQPYYLAPATGGAKPYRLLLEAMRDTNKVAIARVVIRSKEQLVAVRPMGEGLGMIERKPQGEESVVQPPPEEISEPAPDLMSALKASLEAVRAREGAGAAKGKAKPRKPAAAKASAPKAAGAKATSVKKPAEKKAGATRRAATKR